MKRYGVSKSKSAGKFKSQVGKTHVKNLQVMRGGWRL